MAGDPNLNFISHFIFKIYCSANPLCYLPIKKVNCIHCDLRLRAQWNHTFPHGDYMNFNRLASNRKRLPMVLTQYSSCIYTKFASWYLARWQKWTNGNWICQKNKIVDWLEDVGNQLSCFHWKWSLPPSLSLCTLSVDFIYRSRNYSTFTDWENSDELFFLLRRWREKALLVAGLTLHCYRVTHVESRTWANTLENYLLHGAINRTALTHVIYP